MYALAANTDHPRPVRKQHPEPRHPIPRTRDGVEEAVSSDKVLLRARAHQWLDPRAELLHSGDEIVERQHHPFYARHCEIESIVTAMRAAIAGGIVNTAPVANNWMPLVMAARPAMSVNDSRL